MRAVTGRACGKTVRISGNVCFSTTRVVVGEQFNAALAQVGSGTQGCRTRQKTRSRRIAAAHMEASPPPGSFAT